MRADLIRPGEPMPWAWWVFDATEPRRTAAGEPSPLDASATYFAAHVTPSAWESEAAYLDRISVTKQGGLMKRVPLIRFFGFGYNCFIAIREVIRSLP